MSVVSISIQLPGNRSVSVPSKCNMIYELIHGDRQISKTEKMEIASMLQDYDFLIRQETKKERVELIEEIHKAIVKAGI